MYIYIYIYIYIERERERERTAYNLCKRSLTLFLSQLKKQPTYKSSSDEFLHKHLTNKINKFAYKLKLFYT